MKLSLSYFLSKLYFLLILPLCVLFSDSWLFLEFASITQNIVDTAGSYILIFILIIYLIYSRNELYQLYSKENWKTIVKVLFYQPLIFPIKFIFYGILRVFNFFLKFFK
jgi:hypothetical protein